LEFCTVKQGDDQRREGEGGGHSRRRQQDAPLRLLVEQAIAGAVVFGGGGQTRVKVGPHGFQKDSDIHSTEGPGGLIQSGDFKPDFAQNKE
jgi:hypothetical protein